MKPNFNPQYTNLVRVRLHTGEVVDAEYYRASKHPRSHLVIVPGRPFSQSVCLTTAEKPLAPKKCRFVYPLECMPDYKPKS